MAVRLEQLQAVSRIAYIERRDLPGEMRCSEQQAQLSKAEAYYVALTALADVKFLVGLRPDAPLDLVPVSPGASPPAEGEEQQP